MRIGREDRETSETKVNVEINLDKNKRGKIDTGMGFMDHMIELMAFHGGFDMNVKCIGDLNVDAHHSVEDLGLAIGTALKKAMGDKVGIKRYADVTIPMDESLAQVCLDFSGRAYLSYKIEFERERIGGIDTQVFKEFFRAFSQNAGLTLHINLVYGENEHHKIEAVFKALGRALRSAVKVESNRVESSKGVLE